MYIKLSTDTVTIEASAGASDTITPSGSVGVTSGVNQTFIIIPTTGYSISQVLVDIVNVGTTTSYAF